MADEIIAKYKADLKDYNSQIDKGTKQAQKDFDKTNKSASGLNEVMGTIGKTVAAAFAIDKIVAFTAEASKLAAEGEGIRKAFERVGDPKLLQGLRDATRGTVSDLELMKNAVKASNFKIPLEQLAKLFEFARRRAKETGESVEFLVESITTGIGRKSPLILDNLGISAVELRKRLKGVGTETAGIGDIAKAVGDIATDELQKMGDEAETTKDRMDKLAASTDNLKESFGRLANSGIMSIAADIASKALDKITDSLNEVENVRFEAAAGSLLNLGKMLKEAEADVDSTKKAMMGRKETEGDQLEANRNFIIALEKLAAIRSEVNKRTSEGLILDEHEISLIDKKIAAYEELKAAIPLVTLNTLNNEMRDLTKQLKDAAIGGSEFWRILGLINDKQKELFEATAQTKLFEHLKEDVEEMVAPVDDLAKSFDDLAVSIKGAYGEFDAAAAVAFENQKQMDATDEMLENQKTAAKGTAQTWENAFGQASNFAGQFYDMNRRREELQVQYQSELLQQQLEAGVISQEEYDEKIRGIQQERASAAKQSAMFNAVINTAQSVTSALAAYDYASAILFGVLGAAEIATIAAQPIPQFAKGTKNAPAGFKWVGEEGPELIYDGGGYPIITHEESMKILEKYHIPTVDIGRIEAGGFGGMAESAKLNGFNDMNILQATDRLRASNRDGFVFMAKELGRAMKGKRRGYA